jgi:Mg2+/Co2+ transporter CorB
MSIEVIVVLLAIVALLLLSAFFNGSETALTAASRARMHALEQEGNKKARLVNVLLQRPEKMIGSVLLGNTLVDVLAASLATSLGLSLFGPAGVAYATGIVTLLIVIFSAVLPKTYALASPDKGALMVAPFMRGVIWLLTPATIAIAWIVRMILKLTPSKSDDAANILAAHEEIRGTIELQTMGGAVARGDANMLGGVLDLGDLEVADIMVHRTKMEMVNADDPPQKIVDDLVKSQYSRVPIWKNMPENIVGVLHTKDMLSALSRTGWQADKLEIASFSTAPWYVPDSTSLKDQLNQFLKRKAQLALVVDEYGEVQGLITLEDILEEIVGQISDEHDTEAQAIRVQPDGTVNVDGAVAIRDLNRHMDWDLPSEEATTVAGLVIHEAQAIPEPGQAFTFHGYRFEILRKTRNRLTAVRIRAVAPQPQQSKPAGDNDTLSGG